MNIHHLRLSTAPFDSVASGLKTIESRVYDEKRKAIQIGDKLIFTNRDDINQTASVEVIGLLHYETFHDLFSFNDLEKFNGKSVEWLESQVNEFYSVEEQQEGGVIGIEFKLVQLSRSVKKP